MFSRSWFRLSPLFRVIYTTANIIRESASYVTTLQRNPLWNQSRLEAVNYPWTSFLFSLENKYNLFILRELQVVLRLSCYFRVLPTYCVLHFSSNLANDSINPQQIIKPTWNWHAISKASMYPHSVSSNNLTFSWRWKFESINTLSW